MSATRFKTALWLFLTLALATASCAPPEREIEELFHNRAVPGLEAPRRTPI
jgi:hypothetical protein